MLEKLEKELRTDTDFLKASPTKRGHLLEERVAKYFEKDNYKTWIPPKAKYRSQDILRAFDIIAVSEEDIVLVQVCSSNIPQKKEDKVKSVPVPSCCRKELWCWRNRRKEPSFEVRKY